ncbi:MAG: ATP-binding protein, partial [Pirellulaceae bacterium]
MQTIPVPQYFDEIRRESDTLWKKLEDDPVLAGPWRQLFSQVKSPKHVLSELLQNADDAGATSASVYIDNNTFIFEHDGHDFSADELRSLCRFGFSNKRSLRTIGFRGIGFKSAFSLGPTVRLNTQTLSIQFRESRFTYPEWVDAHDVWDRTRISVDFIDDLRRREIENSLSVWSMSPISLLFFSNIRLLSIQGETISKEIVFDNEDLNFQRINLTGSTCGKIDYYWSEPESFPPAAIAEIRQERNAEDLELPPCRVELFVCQNETPRVYVVLPTGATTALPFSCNGPFIQDPARFGIKDPSVSPTNRWLLERVGKLAADIMKQRLNDDSLEMKERANGYDLLPKEKSGDFLLNDNISSCVIESFAERLGDEPLLLTTEGGLASSENCAVIHPDIQNIWSSAKILEMLGWTSDKSLLAFEVPERIRAILKKWGWISPMSVGSFLEWISTRNVPKPSSWNKLGAFWQMA